MDIKIIQTRGQINVYLFTENCHVEFEKSDLIYNVHKYAVKSN